MPACCAGEPVSTIPTTGGGELKPIRNSTVNRMIARMMFMTTPAETITIRLPIGLLV